jgi:phosphate transport system permease protein
MIRAEALTEDSARRLAARRRRSRSFTALSWVSTAIGLAFLALVLTGIVAIGWPWLDWKFLTSFPSRFPEESGIFSALVGTLLVGCLTALLAFPLGIGAAIYLEEYAPDNWLTNFLQINIANLAGVPSIIYGLLGLGLFVSGLQLGRSLLAGAMTLALLVLPVTILASREALRAVPDTIRQAAYAVGATRWQVIRHHVLVYALPGILTGTILAISRAVGETAPLIAIGALVIVRFLPEHLMDIFTVLPIQIWNWTSMPDPPPLPGAPSFKDLAGTASLVLLLVALLFNIVTIILRQKLQRRW